MPKAVLTCPKCGSRCIETTMLGIIVGPDTNRAKCADCGWSGEAWQLTFVPVVSCRCAHEKCGNIFEHLGYLDAPVCCPYCGRQQMPQPV